MAEGPLELLTETSLRVRFLALAGWCLDPKSIRMSNTNTRFLWECSQVQTASQGLQRRTRGMQRATFSRKSQRNQRVQPDSEVQMLLDFTVLLWKFFPSQGQQVTSAWRHRQKTVFLLVWNLFAVMCFCSCERLWHAVFGWFTVKFLLNFCPVRNDSVGFYMFTVWSSLTSWCVCVFFVAKSEYPASWEKSGSVLSKWCL